MKWVEECGANLDGHRLTWPRPTDDVLTSVHLPQGLRKAGLGKQLFVREMVLSVAGDGDVEGGQRRS